MTTRVLRALGGVVLLAAVAPSFALADTVLAPFVGRTLGGGAKDDFGSTSHFALGGSLSLQGSLLGIEVDAQYVPQFFGGASHSNVASLMAGLTLGAGDPEGTRFFLVAGAGLLRSHVTGHADFFDTDRNSFGLMVGASVIGPLTSGFGVKGDLRYFRGLTNVDSSRPGDIDLSGFHVWRVSVGLAIRL